MLGKGGICPLVVFLIVVIVALLHTPTTAPVTPLYAFPVASCALLPPSPCSCVLVPFWAGSPVRGWPRLRWDGGYDPLTAPDGAPAV